MDRESGGQAQVVERWSRRYRCRAQEVLSFSLSQVSPGGTDVVCFYSGTGKILRKDLRELAKRELALESAKQEDVRAKL